MPAMHALLVACVLVSGGAYRDAGLRQELAAKSGENGTKADAPSCSAVYNRPSTPCCCGSKLEQEKIVGMMLMPSERRYSACEDINGECSPGKTPVCVPAFEAPYKKSNTVLVDVQRGRDFICESVEWYTAAE